MQSLDLHSVAHAHLCSALLRIKAVAESPRLPDEVKNGVPKPDISEEERVALHNVTSGLYNQAKVRATLGAAVADICRVLQVPIPDKKGKLKRGDKKSEPATRKDPEEQPANRAVKSAPEEKTKCEEKPVKSDVSSGDQLSEDEETEWGGLSENDDEEEVVEKALSRFDNRLGGFDSDDEEEFDTANEELDPMEITDESASEDSEGDEPGTQSGADEDESSDSEEESVSGSGSGSEAESESNSDVSAISPPPKASRKDPKKDDQIRRQDSLILPSLMGGYISGSESDASDIDVAPAARKNRRGQRARQAIWEKKFKDKAKHLGQEKAGRDSGWDLKRGAVDGSHRTPWKKGIKTPFEKRPDRPDEQEHVAAESSRPRPPTKKDDEGPLHPSWEARKKAKEAQQTAAFQGKKITFD